MFDEEKQTKTNVTIYHILEDGVICTTFSFPCTEMLIRERPITLEIFYCYFVVVMTACFVVVSN